MSRVTLRWICESDVPAAQALATGAYLRDQASEPESAPATLYVASLSGDAVALGLWQRAADAIHGTVAADRGVRVLRRSTGGPMVRAGEGILYAALALRHGSVLMACPPDRVLNRNVRGFLGGLSLSGAPAHYFGRDVLSVSRRPAALVGWDRLADGRVLLEVFIGHTHSFVPDGELDGYPTPSEPPFAGKEPITLAEAWEGSPPVEQIGRWLAEGHPARFGGDVALDHSSLTDDDRRAAREAAASFLWKPDPDDDELRWSTPRPVPIGWLSSGVRLASDGTFADVRIAGDFMQDHDAGAALARKLAGQPVSREVCAQAINATWDGTAHVIEGLRSLEPILDAVLDAAEGG